MNTRYRLIFRGIRGGMYYCVDKSNGKRTSLNTTNQDEARQLIEARNNAERQPVLNLQIAKAYLAGTDKYIRRLAHGIGQPGRLGVVMDFICHATTLARGGNLGLGG